MKFLTLSAHSEPNFSLFANFHHLSVSDLNFMRMKNLKIHIRDLTVNDD